MSQFVLIGLCMVAGWLFRRSGTLPAHSHKSLNAWIIYLALPAVSFKYLPYIAWKAELLLPVLSPLVVWLGGWIWIRLYARIKNIPRESRGSLTLVSGLANTSFVGFPLVAAYFGEEQISLAVICDQVTFALLSTAGLVVAINSSQNQKLSLGVVAKKVFMFPPFLGCVAALVLPHFVDLRPLSPLVDRLAGTVGPLALFSVGMQLEFDGWKNHLADIATALFYKLLLAPALMVGILFFAGAKGTVAQVAAFEAAMATLVSSGVVADQYEVNPKLASLVIGIGIVCSFVTTFFWYMVIAAVL